MSKYTTVSIPKPLHERIEKMISEKTGFKSVSDYVTYILREIVFMHESEKITDPFTSKDLESIKERLKSLGYL